MTNTWGLLACPFCGGDPVLESVIYGGVKAHCYGCGVDGMTEHNRDAVIAAWNRRFPALSTEDQREMGPHALRWAIGEADKQAFANGVSFQAAYVGVLEEIVSGKQRIPPAFEGGSQ